MDIDDVRRTNELTSDIVLSYGAEEEGSEGDTIQQVEGVNHSSNEFRPAHGRQPDAVNVHLRSPPSGRWPIDIQAGSNQVHVVVPSERNEEPIEVFTSGVLDTVKWDVGGDAGEPHTSTLRIMGSRGVSLVDRVRNSRRLDRRGRGAE